MGDRDISAFVQAREHLFACDGTVDDKMLSALETILNAAHDAGSVTVEIRCVSRADRRGDRLTKFASDIRYARALYDIAPWALLKLIARVRELEASRERLPTGTVGVVTEAMVEVSAICMSDAWHEGEIAWADLNENVKTTFRTMARDSLTAALTASTRTTGGADA